MHSVPPAAARWTEILRRFHTWVGLFNLTALIVFAVSGIAATLPHSVGVPVESVMPYVAPAGFTDLQVAEDVFGRLAIPLVKAPPGWSLSRNDRHDLAFGLYSPNGVYQVAVSESEQVVRVRYSRNSLAEFLNGMHMRTVVRSAPDLRIKLWAIYIDFSIFALLFMALSGIWLWLASRPRLWWGYILLTLGTGTVVLLWLVMR